MPEPIKTDRRYLPGLDGLRAVAVLGVIAYHLGWSAFPGGLLGVSVFFTLSGYLITDLLLSQLRAGEFTLRSFWSARARRLLPALFLVLVVVSAWVTTIGPAQGPDFRQAAATAVLYVNNWWLTLRDVSYFAQFDAPGPLGHLWSLSVEEQFYLLWPLLLVAGTRLVPELDPRLFRPRLGLTILAGALASFALMALLFEPGADPSRVYYGTDTRAGELLVGAALATVWPSQRLRTAVSQRARGTVDAAGAVGLGVIAVMFTTIEEFSPFLYRGGFVILALGVSAVVASVAHPSSRIGPFLGVAPMRWIGARSYGLYLWHFPIIVLTTPEGTTPGLGRAVLQVVATFAVAGLSWRFVENPIRHGALGRIVERVRDGSWREELRVSPVRWAPLLASVVVVLPAFAGFAGVGVEERTGLGDDEISISETVIADPAATPAADGESALPAEGATDPDALGPCTSVVHVGGSTSLGLASSVYIPVEDQRIPAQYARVGVTTQHYEIAGGRAIIEGYQENEPARDSAQRWRDQGYDGCWVFALGTMDAANVAIGGRPGIDERIDIMMAIAGDDPVLWVNVRTIASTGSWRSEVMPPWNEALLRACDRYDNLRVYDWAADVQDDWFEADGIHNDGAGSVERAAHIADALATAFPGPDGPPPPEGCQFEL